MIFGHCNLSGKKQLVVIVLDDPKSVWTLVKRTFKGIPNGKVIRRHRVKHGVVIHGENFYRKNWI